MEMGFSYRKYIFLAVMLLFCFICCIVFTTYVPFLTYAAHTLDADSHSSSFYFALVACVPLFSLLFYGWVFDKYGGHGAFFSGQTFVMAGLALVIFANDPQEFLMATLLLSWGLGSGLFLARAWLFSLLGQKNWVIGMTVIHIITIMMLQSRTDIASISLAEETCRAGALFFLFLLSMIFLVTQTLFLQNSLRFLFRVPDRQSKMSFSSFLEIMPTLFRIFFNAATIITYAIFKKSVMLSTYVLWLEAPVISAIFSGCILYFEKNKDFQCSLSMTQGDIFSFFMTLGACIMMPYFYLLASLFFIIVFIYQFHTISQSLFFLFQKQKKWGYLSAAVGIVQYSTVVLAQWLFSQTDTLFAGRIFLGWIAIISLIFSMIPAAKFLYQSTTPSE